MYINFWYPVCTAEELTADKPVRAKILGTRFVAFRDSNGDAHVLADTCIHRGGSLGKGKVVGDNIACPYHGWEFDGTGRCARIPSLKEGSKIPSRAKVDSYPVIERYEIVFAFLGDLPEEERPPLYDIPEWGKEGWRDSGLVILDLNAYFERSIENGLDPVHNQFVHPLQGNIRFLPEYMDVESDDWTTKVIVRMEPPKPGTVQFGHLRNDDHPEEFGATSLHYGPNTLVTAIFLSSQNSFVQYFFEQPIDPGHTRIFFINMRNCMLEPENDERVKRVNLGIADEDIALVSDLRPVRTPETMTKEILINGDECIGGFREKLKGWEKRGWRVDVKALRDTDGDVAYAIPSPERRTQKNWILDTIPLVQAADTDQA